MTHYSIPNGPPCQCPYCRKRARTSPPQAPAPLAPPVNRFETVGERKAKAVAAELADWFKQEH